MAGYQLKRPVGRAVLADALAGLGLAIAIIVIGPTPALAASGENCWYETDPDTGEVKLICEDPGDGGENDPENDDNSGTGGSSTCTFQGNEIPCGGPEGSVWNGAGCYVGPPLPEQPEVGPNGEEIPSGGQYHVCYQAAGLEGPGRVWVSAGIQLIDPVSLANRAVASMDLDPIQIGIVPESGPDRVGLVGLPVWMWVESPSAQTIGPITASATEGSVSVSATASVYGIAWDMGDGTTVACMGESTPYADHYGKQDSPTCGHRYQKMSTDQPDGAYQVTATSRWIVEWTGGGQSGTIEFDLTTDPLPIRIGEAQVLTQ